MQEDRTGVLPNKIAELRYADRGDLLARIEIIIIYHHIYEFL